jgi:hypothetical protein
VKTALAALGHILAFDVAYRFYINPAFEYAHYELFPSTWTQLLVTYLLAMLPVVGARISNAPGAVGAAIIYALAFVPGQVMALHMWQGDALELILVQVALALSMTVVFWASRRGYREGVALPERAHVLASALTVVAVLVIVVVFRDNMRFVSFEEVYELRAESNEVEAGSLVSYLVMWLPYALLPHHIVRWIFLRKHTDLALGLAASVVIYMATASKAAILTPAIVLIIERIVRSSPDFLRALVTGLAAAQAAIVALIPDEGVLMWVKSIVLVRILGTSGWTMSVYYDYFKSHGYTYYMHIGPLNALLRAYPYGDLPMGMLIGREYTQDEMANFNAGFWASDGFAALGLWGIPVVTVAVALVLVGINRAACGFSARFVSVWLAGFWLALLNLPLTTALLSGGGLLIMALLRASRSSQHASAALQEATGFAIGDGGERA